MEFENGTVCSPKSFLSEVLSRSDVFKLLATEHGERSDPSSFHPSRVKALGSVLYSDLDMWPYQLRGEHNEIIPQVVSDILANMGYKAEDRHVQMVMDELLECQRLVKGQTKELLGAGKIGETLRQVNQIRSAGREYRSNGGNTKSALDMLPCLEGLHKLFSEELDKEQDSLEVQDTVAAAFIRQQHEHIEFATCTDAILEKLVEVKKFAKKKNENELQIRKCDEIITRRVHKFAWTRNEIASSAWRDVTQILHDRDASDMWLHCFGLRHSTSVTDFVSQFQTYTHSHQPFLTEMLTGLMDDCVDGHSTVWAFHRLLSLFGPFRNLIFNLTTESQGRYHRHKITEVEATLDLDSIPGRFMVIPAYEHSCLKVVWVHPDCTTRSTIVSRASGAWQILPRGSAPTEQLRDLIQAQLLWTEPYGITHEDAPKQTVQFAEGSSPLHRACYANNYGMVQILLARGASLTTTLRTWAVDGDYGDAVTPLMLSVMNTVGSPLAVCKLLLGSGADVNALDSKGESALYKAILHNREEVVTLLRESGAHRFSSEAPTPSSLP